MDYSFIGQWYLGSKAAGKHISCAKASERDSSGAGWFCGITKRIDCAAVLDLKIIVESCLQFLIDTILSVSDLRTVPLSLASLAYPLGLYDHICERAANRMAEYF